MRSLTLFALFLLKTTLAVALGAAPLPYFRDLLRLVWTLFVEVYLPPSNQPPMDQPSADPSPPSIWDDGLPPVYPPVKNLKPVYGPDTPLPWWVVPAFMLTTLLWALSLLVLPYGAYQFFGRELTALIFSLLEEEKPTPPNP